MRSGYVRLYDEYLRNVNVNGLYWSHSGNGASTAYALGSYVSGVNPSGGPAYRYSGFSLRCLQE